MVDRRFHVDPRLVDQAREPFEIVVGEVVSEIAALRERAHAHRVAVGRDDGNGFAHVLGRGAVHDDAGA